jgi:transposase
MQSGPIPFAMCETLEVFMSLKPQAIEPIPKETTQVARAAFPNGNTYMKMRDELGTFYADPQFDKLFPSRGQPALSPWRLALVTIMQFAENLTDRQAADAVRSRIDWKYALGLQLIDPGFNYSVLELLSSQTH